MNICCPCSAPPFKYPYTCGKGGGGGGGWEGRKDEIATADLVYSLKMQILQVVISHKHERYVLYITGKSGRLS